MIICFVMFAVGNTVAADFTVPGPSVEFEGWKYIPIMENEAVHSIVLLSSNSNLQTTTIASMWFIKEGSSWLGFAWRSPDQKEALSDIRSVLDLDDESNLYWPVEPNLLPIDIDISTMKEPIISGLFLDDPLLPVVQAQPDPTVLLSILVDTGWLASDASLFKSETRKNQLLNDLASGFLLELNEEGSGLVTIIQGVGAGSGGSCTPGLYYMNITRPICSPVGVWALIADCSSVVPLSGGGCQYNNCWTHMVRISQKRTVKKVNTNCSVCTMTQSRYVFCETDEQVTVDIFGFLCSQITNPVRTLPTVLPCSVVPSSCVIDLSAWGPAISTVCP